MTYRTKVRTIEAYQIPESGLLETPYWFRSRIESREIVYDERERQVWIYPHGKVISMQIGFPGDYVTYDSASNEMWVVGQNEFESRYERF